MRQAGTGRDAGRARRQCQRRPRRQRRRGPGRVRRRAGTATEACADFNQFVNAKWVAANPIPADQTVWGSFNLLREKSLADQHALVDAADKGADSAAAGSMSRRSAGCTAPA
ncbi:hypothetical protein [Rhodanobacter lindaniclasticus]